VSPDTKYTCVDVDWMVRRLVERVSSGQVFILLDACRYNAMDDTFKSRYTPWLSLGVGGGWLGACTGWDSGAVQSLVCAAGVWLRGAWMRFRLVGCLPRDWRAFGVTGDEDLM
jgi:hypothetical protein